MLSCPAEYSGITSDVYTYLEGKLYPKAHGFQIRPYRWVYIRIEKQPFKRWERRSPALL